jgi:hypothetical protein
MKTMTRDEVQPAWEVIVYFGCNDYNSLTRDERIWFNLEPLIMEGLWDHYMNNGAEHNSDAIEDLEYLNFHAVAELLREFNRTYFPNGVPKSPDDRQNILDQFSEDQLENDIETMDDQFWEIADELEEKILEHINLKGLGKKRTLPNGIIIKSETTWWKKLFK